MEIKLFLATLFQKYDFDIVSNKELIDSELYLTWRPKDVLFKVKKRIF